MIRYNKIEDGNGLHYLLPPISMSLIRLNNPRGKVAVVGVGLMKQAIFAVCWYDRSKNG